MFVPLMQKDQQGKDNAIIINNSAAHVVHVININHAGQQLMALKDQIETQCQNFKF